MDGYWYCNSKQLSFKTQISKILQILYWMGLLLSQKDAIGMAEAMMKFDYKVIKYKDIHQNTFVVPILSK